MIRVNASGTPVCSGYESGNTCNLNLIDHEPIIPVACLPQGKRSLTYTHPNIDNWSEVLNGVSSADETLYIKIYDCEGRIVGNETLTTGSFFEWEKYNLSAGIYLISAQGLQGAYTLRRIAE